MAAVTDATLVLRTLEGDKTAFAELYDRYARLVRVICYDNTKDLYKAQDLAQEVFLRAYVKLGELKKPDRFGPWLVSMARNVGREFRRGQFRDRHLTVGLDVEVPPTEELKTPNQRLDFLEEAIEKLDGQEKLALHVYYLQGKDVAETRKILRVSRASLYRLLAGGKQKLESYIREKEKSN
ncbi:MAG: sigma-70 family RNA polymerase sigma factor [Planctomycetes bacterium]|nr:sigma-70 family RNA polymerase sigma factor [Planctomycetota bacterium]